MSACQHRKISTFYFTESGEPSGLWACAECSHKFVPIDRELALEEENARLREAWRKAEFIVDAWDIGKATRTALRNIVRDALKETGR